MGKVGCDIWEEWVRWAQPHDHLELLLGRAVAVPHERDEHAQLGRRRRLRHREHRARHAVGHERAVRNATATVGPPFVSRVWLRGRAPRAAWSNWSGWSADSWLVPRDAYRYVCALKLPGRQLYDL